jgi:hypothetical protein
VLYSEGRLAGDLWMREVPWQSVHQFDTFSTVQALATGWSSSALSRAVASGRLLRIRTGVYGAPHRATAVEADVAMAEPARRTQALKRQAVAAALCIPTGVVSHSAAAAIHELPLFGVVPDLPCLTLPPGFRIIERGKHLHRVRLAGSQIVRRGDFRLTTPARTCLDIARESGMEAGLIAADALLRRGGADRSDLQTVYQTMRGRGGSPNARLVVDLADGRHESPLETLSALAMRTLPAAPCPQTTLRSPTGDFLGRVDFFWEHLGVVGEADGRSKYTGDELWREKRREDRLAEHGLVVVRWGFAEVMKQEKLLAKLRRAFRQAEQLRAAGVIVRASPRYAHVAPG